MKRLLGNLWFSLVLLTGVGAMSVGLLTGEATATKIMAGALFGLTLGVFNLVELSLPNAVWVSIIINGLVGALAGFAIAYLHHKAPDLMIWYGLGGMILGCSSRLWITHANL